MIRDITTITNKISDPYLIIAYPNPNIIIINDNINNIILINITMSRAVKNITSKA